MSLSLTTFSSGAVIDATALRDRIITTETYLNEQIAAADRGSAWLKPNHIYRPDFFGAPNPHTTMPSGETYFRSRPPGSENRTFFSYHLNTSTAIPVPGLNITYQLPEAPLATAGALYYVKFCCSFYAYEFGGDDGNMDGVYANSLAAYTVLLVDGVEVNHQRPIMKGSQTAGLMAGAYYPRQQHAYAYAVGSLSAGTHNIGVGIRCFVAGVSFKHIIFRQGNCLVRYFLR